VYNWHWQVLLEAEPGGTGSYLQYLFVGLGWTLATAAVAWVIALAVGALVGTLRTTQMKWVVRLGNLYVEIFRNVPLIVQMFLWFFVVPELLPAAIGDWIKQMAPPWAMFWPAVLCLGIFTSVRVAEQVRAGIGSLPRGQRMAGDRHGPHVRAGLPLRHPAAGLPHHPAAAHFRDDEHRQELLGGLHHRAA
jgi:glutamate/aspartate transport system permease protein